MGLPHKAIVITSGVTAARAGNIESVAASLPCPVEVLDDKTVHSIPPETLRQIVTYDRSACAPPYNAVSGGLNARQVENCVKHMRALKAVCDGAVDDETPWLILEDDVLLGKDHLKSLSDRCDEVRRDGVVYLLGLPSVSGDTQDVSSMYPAPPVCDSILIRPREARFLISGYLPIMFPANLQLGHVADSTGVRVVCGTPNVFVDGSKYGSFCSSLSPNNHLTMNSDYVKARALLAAGGRENALAAKEAVEASPLRIHPNFQHLACLAGARLADPGDPEARAAVEASFAEALKVFDNNSCLITHESDFLADYIKLYAPRRAA
jgi:hypothetical protein